MIYNTCIFAGTAIFGHSDHKMDITFEFTPKNGFQMIYNTCIFAGIAIYGHSDHTMDITIEFTLKSSSK